MSLWSKIKGIWEISGQIDKKDIDDIKGNTGKIETTAKNLKPGEDFDVVDTSTGGFVPIVKNTNEKEARETAAAKAKAKGRTTQQNVRGEA